MTNNQSVFGDLRYVLATIYDDDISAKRVAQDAGLNVLSIGFSKKAIDNWHAILSEAVNANKVDALLEIARKEYVTNQYLQNVYDHYRRIVEQGGRIDPTVQQSIDEDTPALGDSPYMGLKFFDVNDVSIFFGRDQLTTQLVDYLRRHRFLAVVGASGSGKSSLVRAGLVSTLQKGTRLTDGTLPPEGSINWPVHIITPASDPVEALATTLTKDSQSVTAMDTLIEDMGKNPRSLHRYIKRLLDEKHPSADHLLLVIDQFEELFTLCRDKTKRKIFVDNLLSAAIDAGSTIVVIVLRADFYAHCAEFGALRQALTDDQIYIGSMELNELRDAIVKPARQNHWEFEPGLVDLLLNDVSDEPGALPLLSHALRETWERRRGRILTLAGYVGAGRVQGAIAQTAEKVFKQRLTAEQQAIARNIFLRLTELGEEGAQDTRRRVPMTELIPQDGEVPSVEAVVQILADARLITTLRDPGLAATPDQLVNHRPVTYIDVAHEALIREWPTLRDWLAVDRVGLRTHRHLTEAAEGWQTLGRDPGALYRGLHLQHAQAWATDHADQLSGLEKEFLKTSQATIEREKEAAHQRELAHEKTLSNRHRWLVVIVTLLLVLAVTGGWVIYRQRKQAKAEALVTQAQLTQPHPNQLPLSLLLAVESMQAVPSLAAEELLRQVLTRLPVPLAHVFHTGAVNEVAFSPSGHRIATASDDFTVQLLDIATDRTIATLGHEAEVTTATFSPDERWLATGTAEGAVRIWDVETGEEFVRTKHKDLVVSVIFSPDGQWLASSSWDGTAQVWNADSGEEILSITHDGEVSDIAFSPDGQWLASSSWDGTAQVWDIATKQEIARVVHEDGLNAVAFSPDGKQLATASSDFSARIWDIATGHETARITHDDSVGDVAFSPDGKLLATASDDKTVRLWDVASGEETARMAHDDWVLRVAFSPNGKVLATASADRTARVWDVDTGQEIARIVHEDLVWQTVFSADGASLATASQDNSARVWWIAEYQELTRIQHTKFIWDAAFSPDGLSIATVSDDDFTAWIWDARTGQELGRMPANQDPMVAVSFSGDGRWLAIGGDDQTVRVWEIAAAQEVARFTQGEKITAVAFSPNRHALATGSLDMIATIWDVATQEQVTQLRHNEAVNAVAFSPDDQWLATASADGIGQLWEIATQKPIRQFSHANGLMDIAFSPDGKRVATASKDGTARIWDAVSGKEMAVMVHRDVVTSVAFNPDGTWLITGSNDGTARVWVFATGQEIVRIQHGAPVNAVAFSPEGQRLLTISRNMAKVWDIRRMPQVQSQDELIEEICKRVTHNLSVDEWRQYFEGEPYRRTCPDLPASNGGRALEVH